METKTKYKFKFTVTIKKLEFTIPYDAQLAVKLVRGSKSLESKQRIKVSSESNRNIDFNEAITIISTLEYNPKLGCCEEKKAIIRLVTYKQNDRAKRIGECTFNLCDYVKLPDDGTSPADLSPYSMTRQCAEKVAKAIDRFALVHFTVNSELVDIDGDDTFSMYHGTDYDETITDASCMEQVKEMNDKHYYSKGLGSTLKTKITLDMTAHGDDIPIVSHEKVDRFGRSLEKSVPLNFDDNDRNASPNISANSPVKLSDDLQQELDKNMIKINELERSLTERDMEIHKLKGKLDDSKSKADRKEDTINKLLLDTEKLRKANTELEESLRDAELQAKQLTHAKERLESQILKMQDLSSDKENDAAVVFKQELEVKNSEISTLAKQFKDERVELKTQFDALEQAHLKLQSKYDDLKAQSEADKNELAHLSEKNKSEIVELISGYEQEQKKAQECIVAKENVIRELRSENRQRQSQSQTTGNDKNFDHEISKISDKIRQEYMNAIETLQANLQNLKIKYQAEVSGRKNDHLEHKEAIRALKRQISFLQEEKNLNNSSKSTDYKAELLDAKSLIIKLQEENECLQTVLASTKAAWAQSEMDKEDLKYKYSKKKEEVGLYSERIAELELQVVRGKQDLVDAMNSLCELQKAENSIDPIEF